MLVLCVFVVEGMSEVVKAMVSLMNVISPPPVVCGKSARTNV